MTINDVARECGVAASTVSRAFSRPGRVSAATAERIKEAAERLGYRATPLSLRTVTGQTGMIGLVVSDVTNPVYFPLIRGAEAAATERDWMTLLTDAQESARKERDGIDRSLTAVDGLLLAGTRMSDASIRLVAQQLPVVVCNRAVTGVHSVVADNARGIRRAVEHLADLGHTTITYVAGPEASWADGVRWRALREATYELEMRAVRVGPFPPTVDGGVSAVQALRRLDPTAVIAYNDLLAIGLLRGLAAAGVAVPSDVSVIGFDNIFGSDFCTPGLTTVAIPLRGLGGEAVARLAAQIDGGAGHQIRPTVVPTRLVVRDSTAPRRAQHRRARSSPPT
ncbi:LacI family DNA-binding transcriptional regulator [Modestobacter sp. VKM Ac-2977]|uniref:LacI family DNA-binding transcriptional regulator n=1 Tax=Modestobacter sp. VKM Ac-2977 TaxID=3004131 RepID=UPI0022AAAE46|nr:LacI family DNA-binding transcriptional regulator [Modestobacter sp. VKM Ac-2977]MCZ2822698.1 LacI family DNA-binding transcriptional regulator [Modestobacter sp. VKM Ac-2977]